MPVYQKNEKLLKVLQDEGCHVLCYFYLAGINSPERINDDFNFLIRRGVVTRDCFINNPVSLANLLGYPCKKVEVKKPEYIPVDGERIIGCWYNPRTKFTHFTVLDKDKKIEYDPLNGKSITVKEGYLDSLRCITN